MKRIRGALCVLCAALLASCATVPDHALEKGMEAFDRQDWESAERIFAQGIHGSKPDERLQYNRALALFMEGRIDDALAQCEEGYQAHPGLLNFLTLRWKILAAAGRSTEAIIAYDRYLSLNPADTAVRLELIDYALEKGYPDEVRFHANFLIRYRKEQEKAWAALAEVDGPDSEAARISAYLSGEKKAEEEKPAAPQEGENPPPPADSPEASGGTGEIPVESSSANESSSP